MSLGSAEEPWIAQECVFLFYWSYNNIPSHIIAHNLHASKISLKPVGSFIQLVNNCSDDPHKTSFNCHQLMMKNEVSNQAAKESKMILKPRSNYESRRCTKHERANTWGMLRRGSLVKKCLYVFTHVVNKCFMWWINHKVKASLRWQKLKTTSGFTPLLHQIKTYWPTVKKN